MTRFLDGPAANLLLELKRSPLFLRVVQSPAGDWDALDQLDDAPAPGERVIVYRRFGKASSIHVDGIAKGKRFGKWFQMADYRLVGKQPGDAVIRDAGAWQKWCLKQQKENGP